MGELIVPQVSLPLCVTSVIKPVFYKSLSNTAIERYQIAGDLPDVEVARAIAKLESWMAPMARNQIMAGLAQLKLMTSERKQNQNDLEAQMNLYAMKLMDWPGDVVGFVLRSQGDVSKWWPDWKELLDRLEYYSRKNRMALSALRDYQAGKNQPCTAPKAKQIDHAQISEVMKDTLAKMQQGIAERAREDRAYSAHNTPNAPNTHGAQTQPGHPQKNGGTI